MEDFGVSMPDGEPNDVQTAADAWDELASEPGMANLPILLDQKDRAGSCRAHRAAILALAAGFGTAAAEAGKLAVKMKRYVDRVLAAERAAKFVDKVIETGEDLAARSAALQRIADLMAQRTADIVRGARKSRDQCQSRGVR
ncbi:hypothetical protein [Nocardia bovistercoris]|uniref:Uncharacterized protein n=1 Tax=Nocardia bovistercoris TaxID=2785916 RepID=A0A931ICE6_9NOCA|nr:hypothetical protein [Nocardia bovistercoris]MBH0778844.1 hypothetical protein [Nocardia bovistercoris]